MKKLTFIFVALLIGVIGNSQVIIDTNLVRNSAIRNIPEINNNHSQFSPAYADGGIIYIEYRQNRKSKDLTRTEKAFEIKYIDNLDQTIFGVPALFSKDLTSPYVEGPGCFSEDKSTFYFTRSAMSETGAKKSADRLIRLKIMRSDFQNENWSTPQEELFAIGDFNYCHPSISKDGSVMVFASDLPGGYGKMDLYIMQQTDEGWSSPFNLGENVNSSGNDWFPYIHESGILFYASDGKDAKRLDLDIYALTIDDNKLSQSFRLPPPINTTADDFGLVVDDKAMSGFLSSNRIGGKGRDDIYQIFMPAGAISKLDDKVDSILVTFFLEDRHGRGIDGATLQLGQLSDDAGQLNLDEYRIDILPSADNKDELLLKLMPKGIEGFNLKTNEQGMVETLIPVDSRLVVSVVKDGYKRVSSYFETNKQREVVITMEKQPVKRRSTKPTDIFIPTEKGVIVVFDNIYYDYNSAVIKTGAARELDALIDAMKINDRMRVQLSAHTDSRGNEVYNQLLSDKRAQSARQYLITRGISGHRIVALGFGESRLRNHCSNGVNCAEEEHKFNRRTAVKIIDN